MGNDIVKFQFGHFLAALLAGLGLVTGCKRAPAEAVAPLVNAFELGTAQKSAGDGQGQGSPDMTAEDDFRNRQLADLAVSAYKSNDLVTVGSSLRTLRSTPTMTDNQRMAVQDAMINFQKNMAERADAGDAAAQAALDLLRGSHLRR
jgi:hypothetical protein